MPSTVFDVVVVGAGSAGAVVAARLSEDGARSVCLIEAGPDFPDELETPPSFYSAGTQFPHQAVPEHDWGYVNEPFEWGRGIPLPRGKLVGGSSMTNGTMCVRAAPFDFDRWVAAGAEGWSWQDVLPSYERAEAELSLRTYRREGWQPIQRQFEQGMLELGLRPVEEMLAANAWLGTVGPTTFNRRDEVRQGTLVTYVRKARGRSNFILLPDTLADRVIFRGGRAIGVRVVRGGRLQDVQGRLVVLAAGAYNTPGILVRSGIGPAPTLRRLGVQPIAELPVGERLLDHAVIFFRVHAPELADPCSPGSSVVARAPDNEWFAVAMTIDEREGVCGLAFVSTGDNDEGSYVKTVSLDPTVPPRIVHRYERAPFVHASRMADGLLGTSPFAGVRYLDRNAPLRMIFEERVNTAYHPAGTCPIGSVLDPDLRVHGVDALLVADASIFPVHISNNTNLTACMVGEHAARLLLGEL